jgi:hypothetical protein
VRAAAVLGSERLRLGGAAIPDGAESDESSFHVLKMNVAAIVAATSV